MVPFLLEIVQCPLQVADEQTGDPSVSILSPSTRDDAIPHLQGFRITAIESGFPRKIYFLGRNACCYPLTLTALAVPCSAPPATLPSWVKSVASVTVVV